VIQGPLELLGSAFLHASWNAMRNASVVFAQLLAILLGERIPARQRIGAAFVAGGGAALSWPGPP
jgi:drug/metabolite transporter (DMT)-like permease